MQKRHMTRWSAVVALLVMTAIVPIDRARAQAPAGQTRAPEIPFDSVANFFKLPAGMNFGEVPGVAVNSKGHVYVFSRSNSASGPAFGTTAAQLLEFGPKGEFIREIGKDLYGWAFAHSVRIDKDDNIWAIDKGSDMIVRLNQAGRVIWVFGRRKESADGAEPWEHTNPPLPAGRRAVSAADGHRLGFAGQHLHHRRLRQLARREVRPQRRLGEVVGATGTGPGQFHLPHAIAIDTMTTSTSATAPTGASRCSTPKASSCASARSTFRPTSRTRAVNGPRRTGRHAAASARPTRCASRRGRTR